MNIAHPYRKASLITALVVFVFSSLGIGYRHLWQDEVETADRARTILQSGVPRTIDADGNVSVNAGGLEIEEGTLHRYTPWGQFYFAAGGLFAARALGVEKDAAVRMPFVAAHAAAAGMMTYSLSAFAALPTPWSAAFSIGISMLTPRLLYNRTARYHALLDLMLMIGLVGIGGIRTRRPWAPAAVAASVLILPHVQTFAGSLLALLVAAGTLFVLSEQETERKAAIRKFLIIAVVPGLVSLVLLLWLIRPAMHQFWGLPRDFDLMRALKTGRAAVYSLGFLAALGFYCLAPKHTAKERNAGIFFFSCIIAVLLCVFMIDKYPFSQMRYYLSVPLFALFLPVVAGFGLARVGNPPWVWLFFAFFAFTPEFAAGNHKYFQGVRIVLSDWERARRGDKQPLHEAVEHIKINGREKQRVLFDYVPQFANWYLPEFRIALMPDARMMTPLNKDNPIWREKIEMPDWHVWYPFWGSGVWPQRDTCDFTARNVSADRKFYELYSKRLNASHRMCVEKVWRVNILNNAPQEEYSSDAFSESGVGEDIMVLGRACGPKDVKTSRKR